MSLPDKNPKKITVAEIRGFVNGVMGSTPEFSNISNPVLFLMTAVLRHFKGGVSPIILRPLLVIEVYKEDAPRLVIENARKDIVDLRDFCLDYPLINERLDILDEHFTNLLAMWAKEPKVNLEDEDINEYLIGGEDLSAKEKLDIEKSIVDSLPVEDSQRLSDDEPRALPHWNE